jgi:adenylate cyclase
MFTLVLTTDGETRHHDLSQGATVAGRAPTCDLVLDDSSISRRHARFDTDAHGCRVTDLGSRNGVYLNGELIPEAQLRDGDTLMLGRVPLRVREIYNEQLVLSEDRQLVDDPGTIYRRIEQGATMLGATAPASDRGTSPPVPAEAARLLAILSDVSRALARTRSLADVLDRVVALTFDNIRAERAFVILTDPESGEPVPRLARRRDGTTPSGASISRTIVRTAIRERVAMLASDARFDPRLSEAESILAHDIRAFMCAPLWNDDQVVGTLYVDNPRGRPFEAADLDLLATLSNYAAVAIERARLTDRVTEETRRRERLQRYHSPAVVNRILQAEAEADTAFIMQERDLTVLFLDIVGFTTLSEKMAPAHVARLLNDFFTRMTGIVFRRDGTLDKYIGDALLAVFGAPLEQPDHALRAVRAALDMRHALAEFNRERGGRPIEVRIALSSGLAMVGDIGSPARRDFTVLGDVVNTASRLESDVALPGQIVISGATFDRVRGHVEARSLGEKILRGRRVPVEVFEVIPAAAAQAS